MQNLALMKKVMLVVVGMSLCVASVEAGRGREGKKTGSGAVGKDTTAELKTAIDAVKQRVAGLEHALGIQVPTKNLTRVTDSVDDLRARIKVIVANCSDIELKEVHGHRGCLQKTVAHLGERVTLLEQHIAAVDEQKKRAAAASFTVSVPVPVPVSAAHIAKGQMQARREQRPCMPVVMGVDAVVAQQEVQAQPLTWIDQLALIARVLKIDTTQNVLCAKTVLRRAIEKLAAVQKLLPKERNILVDHDEIQAVVNNIIAALHERATMQSQVAALNACVELVEMVEFQDVLDKFQRETGRFDCLSPFATRK